MSEEQFRWVSKLIGFDFEIQYKPGSSNIVANSLSRQMMFSVLSVVQLGDMKQWEKDVTKNGKLSTVTQDLTLDSTSHPGYQLQRGRLFYNGKLVIPRQSSRIPTLISEFHNSPMGGHSGFFRTFKRVAKGYFGKA